MAATPEPQPSTTPGNPAQSYSGLHFEPASTLAEVEAAWELVYRSYLRAGLITPHPFRLHTVPHAVQPHSVVICGKIQCLTVSTLSGYFDQPAGLGLPLDKIYRDELDELRADGRTLMEIGLFADRREHLHRSVDAILELMRFVCYFGVTHGATDGIIGVHPQHAAFYTRLLGFEQIGEERPYETVNNNAALLLRLDWYRRIAEPTLPRGLGHFKVNPIAAEHFAGRAIVDQAGIRGTRIAEFLQGESAANTTT